MQVSWETNILCEIRNGQAYLKKDLQGRIGCTGSCHACKSFRGADLADTGKEYFRSVCAALDDHRLMSQ